MEGESKMHTLKAKDTYLENLAILGQDFIFSIMHHDFCRAIMCIVQDLAQGLLTVRQQLEVVCQKNLANKSFVDLMTRNEA